MGCAAAFLGSEGRGGGAGCGAGRRGVRVRPCAALPCAILPGEAPPSVAPPAARTAPPVPAPAPAAGGCLSCPAHHAALPLAVCAPPAAAPHAAAPRASRHLGLHRRADGRHTARGHARTALAPALQAEGPAAEGRDARRHVGGRGCGCGCAVATPGSCFCFCSCCCVCSFGCNFCWCSCCCGSCCGCCGCPTLPHCGCARQSGCGPAHGPRPVCHQLPCRHYQGRQQACRCHRCLKPPCHRR